MNHRCHFLNCPTATPPRLLFCAQHWAMVPPVEQTAVWAAYRSTKQATRARDRDYLSACAKATEAVAAKLGLDGSNNTYRRLLKLLDEVDAAREARHTQGSKP